VVFAAAVLVHPIADVRRRGSHLDRFTTGKQPPPQAGPTSFISSGLQPVQIISVDLYGRESHRRSDQMINRDRGQPGPVRRNPHMVNLWAASVRQKQVRRTYLLVLVWPMVQDREHKRIPQRNPA
jgi:hypothetical protein